MKIISKAKNTTLTQSIENFIDEKIGSLDKFIKALYDDYQSPSSGKLKPEIKAQVEIGKETKHHRKGPFFRAECQIDFLGKNIRAEAFSKDLRDAIIKVKDELQVELKKQKGKLVSQRKRSSRAVKREIKLSPEAKLDQGRRIREEGI
jgi:ribosomal subunit interface protein